VGSNPNTLYFHIIVNQPSASCNHCRSAHLTLFSLLPAEVYSVSSGLSALIRLLLTYLLTYLASYPPGKANQVAAYQWMRCGVTE